MTNRPVLAANVDKSFRIINRVHFFLNIRFFHYNTSGEVHISDLFAYVRGAKLVEHLVFSWISHQLPIFKSRKGRVWTQWFRVNRKKIWACDHRDFHEHFATSSGAYSDLHLSIRSYTAATLADQSVLCCCVICSCVYQIQRRSFVNRPNYLWARRRARLVGLLASSLDSPRGNVNWKYIALLMTTLYYFYLAAYRVALFTNKQLPTLYFALLNETTNTDWRKNKRFFLIWIPSRQVNLW